jgi:hypothetical protein
MDKTKKQIAFRQKVPRQILENGLYLFLRDGKFDDEELKRDLQEYFSGANRLAKAATTVNSTIKKNHPIILKLKKKLDADAFLKLPDSDRAAVIMCLLCLAYPFAYETLITAANIFKIQNYVTRDLLHQKMGGLYGSNRAIYIGIGELLPTFIELGLFRREKVSLYSKQEQKPILNPLVSELFIYTDIKLSGLKTALVEDLYYRSWFTYFSAEYQSKLYNTFLQYSDGSLGSGYITIKKSGKYD